MTKSTIALVGAAAAIVSASVFYVASAPGNKTADDLDVAATDPRPAAVAELNAALDESEADGARLRIELADATGRIEQLEVEAAKTGRRRRYSWDFDPHMDIFEGDLNGKNLRKLTDVMGYDAEGAYSPDGRLIAFCSDRDGDPDLYLMNADGSGLRQLTDVAGYDGGPFISPDGRWVVYRTDRKRPEMLQIHAIGIDGKNDVALTDNIGVNWAPYWHPTEPYMIWTGADHSDPTQRPNYDLWLMKYSVQDGRLVPGPMARVTDHPSADVLPVFSPDGQQLMWTSNRTADRSSQLWIADFKLPE